MADKKWNPVSGEQPRCKRDLTRGNLLAYFATKDAEAKAEFKKWVNECTTTDEDGVKTLDIKSLRGMVIPKYFPSLTVRANEFFDAVEKW